MAQTNKVEANIINCQWCDFQLDLDQTDWCNNCDTSIFDDKMNNNLNKLFIKNIHNTRGLNIEGISIDDWIVTNETYQFFAYIDGHNWLCKLWRHSIKVDDKELYRFELHSPGSRYYTKYLETDVIKTKRLFYKAIKELVAEHIDFVTDELVAKAFQTLKQKIK
jgi:hypothetical protein